MPEYMVRAEAQMFKLSAGVGKRALKFRASEGIKQDG